MRNWFRRKGKKPPATRSSFACHTSSLPDNFYSKLLEKEIQVEHNPSVDSINQLVGLYQEAIESYEQMKDPRYIDIQDRMHKMIVRHSGILSAASPKGRHKPQLSDIPEEEDHKSEERIQEEYDRKKAEAEKSRALLALQLREQTKQDTLPPKKSLEYTRIVASHSSDSILIANKVMSDKKSQEGSLLQRLEKRKLNNSRLDCSHIWREKVNQTFAINRPAENKDEDEDEDDDDVNPIFSMADEIAKDDERERQEAKKVEVTKKGEKISSGGSSRRNSVRKTSSDMSTLQQTIESDISGGPSVVEIPKSMDELETQIEEVMERLFSEKHHRLAEIKLKNQADLVEIMRQSEGLPEAMKALMIENSKKLMNDQIQKISSEMDLKRKEEIRAVRASYYAR